MQSRLTSGARKVRIHSHSGNPCQPIAGKDEGPAVAFFAWHACVDEDVLKLAGASATKRTHRQARPAKPKVDIEIGL